MKNELSVFVAPVLGIIAAIFLVVGGWKLERWINYKISYSSQVTEQVQPLVDRVSALEKRVEQLEKK
jgi:biopolymer transport protein ExbB/TolQ